MFCKNCGEAYAEGELYCKICGADLNADSLYFDTIRPHEYSTEKKERESMAFFVLSLISLVLPSLAGTVAVNGVGIGGPFISIISLVLSCVAMALVGRYKRRHGKLEGIARIGNVLSIVSLVISIIKTAVLVFALVIVLALIVLYVIVIIGILGGAFNESIVFAMPTISSFIA